MCATFIFAAKIAAVNHRCQRGYVFALVCFLSVCKQNYSKLGCIMNFCKVSPRKKKKQSAKFWVILRSVKWFVSKLRFV